MVSLYYPTTTLPLQAKREQAKKEGRLLTKKQKEEQRAAELRKQALLASGVQIEGLQQGQGTHPPKKVVYDNRKKKKGPTSAAGSSHPGTRDPSPVRESATAAKPEPTPATPEPPTSEPADDAKDDWEASSEEEEAQKKKALEVDALFDGDASSRASTPNPQQSNKKKTERKGLPTFRKPKMDDDIIASMDIGVDIEI